VRLTTRQATALRITAYLLVGGVIFIVSLPLIVLANLPRKSDAPHAFVRPERLDGAAAPILQFEKHTCGLLALSAAYRIYGLTPADENLRTRLGVDLPANPLDSTSTGTLHPDLLRVLVQDGFGYALPDPAQGPAPLRSHISEGNVALLLIARRQNGNLHWVLTDACGDEQLRIVDSLEAEAYHEPLVEFTATCVLSIVTIEPARGGTDGDVEQAHIDGLAELNRVRGRLGRANPD
jgi:hypothetical protein